ncbi:MAG: hypothetical protein ABSA23_15670 [Anaerolineales bacterium]|jgi:hypothetical protein
MAQAVYKLFRMSYTPAWYALSAEEQHDLAAKVEASRKAVGGEVLAMVASLDEKWSGWGVEKYPSLEAVAQHGMTLYMMKWFIYVTSETTLGVEIPPSLM